MKEYQSDSGDAFRGRDKLKTEQEELRQLREEVKRLKMEKKILKKPWWVIHDNINAYKCLFISQRGKFISIISNNKQI